MATNFQLYTLINTNYLLEHSLPASDTTVIHGIITIQFQPLQKRNRYPEFRILIF